MVFKFNFSQDEDEDSVVPVVEDNVAPALPSRKVELEQLASVLPQELQAESIPIQGLPCPLFKRDLADIKFQLAQEDSMEGNSLSYLADNCDLVKGVYEGGFKTWECSLDLASYISQNLTNTELEHKSILELGCGSALPGIAALLVSPTARVDFQDYNDQVLSLLTFPNIVLNTVAREHVTENNGAIELQVDQQYIPGRVRLFAGDWGSLLNTLDLSEETKYDLILTSETIYSEESIPKLYSVIKSALKPSGVVLVAAKNIYFGVGGGILAFKALVQQDGMFDVQTVWETSGNNVVRREVLKLIRKIDFPR
ncbi:uncharacterized protein VTP21DRAFT_3851 [Calcarisporiella thermophila]|uniref:uncharacterized protein n=1 Tax=Calcarisporiella thermophila TaxID=911321 RepID=UPI0037425E59